MSIFGVEFEQSLRGDAVLLGAPQVMIVVVQTNRRPLPSQLRVDPAALVDCLGKAFEAVSEPAPPWPHIAVFAVVEALDIAVEILAREGRPDAVAKFFGHAVDGNVEDAADEEMLTADHAEIFGQEIAVEA